MSIIKPELEIVNSPDRSIRYLEHGWPSNLCRWHFHEEYELHFIAETTGNAFIGDYMGPFSAGSLFLIGPYVPHNWISDKSYKADIALRDMMFQFNADMFDQTHYPEFHELQNLFRLSLLGVMFENFDSLEAKNRLSDIKNAHGLKRVILALDFLDRLNKWPHKKTLALTHVTQANNLKKYKHINNVVNYILEHYAENITLKDMSNMIGYSDSAFSRHFHLSTGRKFSEFLNSVRIGQACMMLYESSHSVSQICYDVGFQNLSNFNRQFFKLKNMTPTQYRQQATQDLTIAS